jgi:chloramphenicol 3-O-phosphotransferase
MVHDGAQSPEKKLVLVAGLPRFFKVSHTRIFQGILAEPNISRSFDAFELEQE